MDSQAILVRKRIAPRLVIGRCLGRSNVGRLEQAWLLVLRCVLPGLLLLGEGAPRRSAWEGEVDGFRKKAVSVTLGQHLAPQSGHSIPAARPRRAVTEGRNSQ